MMHWESVKANILALLAKLDPSIIEIYRASLEAYKEIDWYGFQKLPIVQRIFAFVKGMELTRTVSDAQAKMLLRVMMEEFYALLSYQNTGCRIIRPSPALVHELLDTDVTFKLVEIRPPWPFVYVALPRDCGVVIPHVHSSCGPDCKKKWSAADGIYVTWAESGSTTKEYRNSRDLQEIVTENGEMKLRVMDGIRGERMIEENDAFGDWFARFLVVACDGHVKGQHNYSVHYFNMHWANSNVEDAEGAFTRFEGVYTHDDAASWDSATVMERNRIFHLVANTFLYMSMPQGEGDTVFKPNMDRERYRTLKDKKSSKWRRNLRARLSEEMPTEEWVVGQTVRVIDCGIATGDTGSGTSGEHSSPRTHWRRAHWTTRWVGPHDGERKKLPRWIRATLVRGKGEAPESTTYKVGKEQV